MSLKFGSKIKEIRIHMCQTSKKSAGARNFIECYYVQIKMANPRFPILIRECSGIEPRLWVRYEKGCETNLSLAGMDAGAVMEALRQLIYC